MLARLRKSEENRNQENETGKKAKDSNKNEQHGDSGRALDKAQKQVDQLKQKLNTTTSRSEKQKIQQKINNIMDKARKKAKGENHSRKEKR